MTATPKMWPRSFRRSGANPASPSGCPPRCTGGGVVVTLRRCSSPSAPRMRPVRRVSCPRRHWAVDPGADLGEDRVDLRVRPGRGVLTASGVGQPFSVPNWARISTVRYASRLRPGAAGPARCPITARCPGRPHRAALLRHRPHQHRHTLRRPVGSHRRRRATRRSVRVGHSTSQRIFRSK